MFTIAEPLPVQETRHPADIHTRRLHHRHRPSRPSMTSDNAYLPGIALTVTAQPPYRRSRVNSPDLPAVLHCRQASAAARPACRYDDDKDHNVASSTDSKPGQEQSTSGEDAGGGRGGRITDRALVGLFTVTSFVASGLLFLVQPMLGKLVLPLYGGAASV